MYLSEEASSFVVDGGEGTLSMKALIELIRAVTEKEKSFRFQVLGLSMYPFIKNLDTITISPLTSGHPKSGEVVAFIHPKTGMLVVHRVVGLDGNGFNYLISGDNTMRSDGLVPRSNILGYVSKIEREGKQVNMGSIPSDSDSSAKLYESQKLRFKAKANPSFR